MVNRGKGYIDDFVKIPNPYTTTIRKKVVDTKDMDPNLLKRFGYGVTRPMPEKFTVYLAPKSKGLAHRTQLIGF